MSIVCIHQPDFAPYLGFFHRLILSDYFVILDDAQFIKGGWHNRDLIKDKHGKKWLTLPIKKKFPQLICDTELCKKQNWAVNNLNLLKDAYGNAFYFSEIYPQIEFIYMKGHNKLLDFNMDVMNLVFNYFEITTPVFYSSKLDIGGKKTHRLVDLVKYFDGTDYLTGTGSRSYLDENIFLESKVNVIWQEFRHPTYSQLHGEFIPMLSCLDILFNCGRESASILRNSVSK